MDSSPIRRGMPTRRASMAASVSTASRSSQAVPRRATGNFRPLSPDIPGYNGLVLSASLSYVALGSTRLGIWRIARRAVFLRGRPAVTTCRPGWKRRSPSRSTARSTSRRASARSGWRTRTGCLHRSPSKKGRVDHIRSYGAGVGYRMGEDLRIAFTLDNYRRLSEIDDRQYTTSVTASRSLTGYSRDWTGLRFRD